jgi:D-cysteine desulfhydrase family pyridoxal phosphate-dependent enzyme
MGLLSQEVPLPDISGLGPQVAGIAALVWQTPDKSSDHGLRDIKMKFSPIDFCHLPTKIENLPRLSKLLGGPELLIKRDDQTGLAMGGNKARKLEYLVGEGLKSGAETLITTGAAQSNHCRQTAAAAARCGLACTLVLVGPEPTQVSANLFLDQLFGADIRWTDLDQRDQKLKDTYQELAERGAKPYLIPYGGSNAIGAYAYYQAYKECSHQMGADLPDWIVFASSSGGTQAGLALAAASDDTTRILGISVDQTAEWLAERVHQIVLETQAEISDSTSLPLERILVNADYIGEGYGVMNSLDREAIQLFAVEEGILLDPVYTGRAAAGLIDLVRNGFFKRDQRVLFWHTGGTPGLFADRYLPDLI